MNTQSTEVKTLTETENRIWKILLDNHNNETTTSYSDLIPDFLTLDAKQQHLKKRVLNVHISKIRKSAGIKGQYRIVVIAKAGYKLQYNVEG